MTTYYTPSGNPTFDSPGSTAAIRAEFVSIAAAFDNLSSGTEGTSPTSLTIGTGTKVFTTTKPFIAGQFFSAISAANSANYMHGTVVSYIIPTLTTTVSDIGGSGTFADWNLSISGSQGAPGAGITPQAVGFTVTAGTTPKTLTVALDANVAGTNTGDQTPTSLGLVIGTNVLAQRTFGTAANSATTDFDAAGTAAALVVGLWDDRGSFDASVNTYPTTGGSGTAGAVLKGDIWTISVVATSGALLGYAVGTNVRAVVDTPGQTGSNWAVTEVGLGYVPENTANKRTTFQATPDDTHYASEKLVKDSLDGKQATLVSGTNIKTINSQSLLGSGNLVIAGGGGGATNLGATLSATNIIVTSDTGTDATLPAADVTNAGLMTPAQFTKLGGPSTIDIFATQPVSPITEQSYFNSSTGFLMLWTGIVWLQISGTVGGAPMFLSIPILTIDAAIPAVSSVASTSYTAPVTSGTVLTIDATVPAVSVTVTSP